MNIQTLPVLTSTILGFASALIGTDAAAQMHAPGSTLQQAPRRDLAPASTIQPASAAVQGLVPQVVRPGMPQALNPQPLPPQEGSLQPSKPLSMPQPPKDDLGRTMTTGGDRMKTTPSEAKSGLKIDEGASRRQTLRAKRNEAGSLDSVTEYPVSAKVLQLAQRGTPVVPLQPMAAAPAQPGRPGFVGQVSVSAHGSRVAEMKAMTMTCQEAGLPPEVRRITALSPGRSFTIDGYCFGDQIGSISLSGGPGAGARLTFSAWTDTRIMGTVERLRGAKDGNVELAIVTKGGMRAVPRMARFVAERELVRVPASRWLPLGEMTWAASLFPSAPDRNPWPDVRWNTPAPDLPQRFSARLADGCRLTAVGIEGSGFAVASDIAFENPAAPNDAAFRIGWHPAPVGTVARDNRFAGLPAGSDMGSVYRGSYVISAEAQCPVGVQP